MKFQLKRKAHQASTKSARNLSYSELCAHLVSLVVNVTKDNTLRSLRTQKTMSLRPLRFNWISIATQSK